MKIHLYWLCLCLLLVYMRMCAPPVLGRQDKTSRSRQRSEGISSLELESLQVARSTLEMEQEQVLLTTHPSFQPSCLPLFLICICFAFYWHRWSGFVKVAGIPHSFVNFIYNIFLQIMGFYRWILIFPILINSCLYLWPSLSSWGSQVCVNTLAILLLFTKDEEHFLICIDALPACVSV